MNPALWAAAAGMGVRLTAPGSVGQQMSQHHAAGSAGTAARQARIGAVRGQCRPSSELPTPSTPLPSLPGWPARRGSCGSLIGGSPGPAGGLGPWCSGRWSACRSCRMDLAAQWRRAMSRCQRRIVSGATSSRSPWRRALGITPSRARSPSSGSGGAAAAVAGLRAGGAGSRSLRPSTTPPGATT